MRKIDTGRQTTERNGIPGYPSQSEAAEHLPMTTIDGVAYIPDAPWYPDTKPDGAVDPQQGILDHCDTCGFTITEGQTPPAGWGEATAAVRDIVNCGLRSDDAGGLNRLAVMAVS